MSRTSDFLAAIDQMSLTEANIDEIRAHLSEMGFWTDQRTSALITRAQNVEIRRLIRSCKDEHDWPLFANIDLFSEDGQRGRAYKQEDYFTQKNYWEVESYWLGRELYAHGMRQGYESREIAKFGPRPEGWRL